MDIAAARQHDVVQAETQRAGLRLVPHHIAQAELRQPIVLREDPELVLRAVQEGPVATP
jgi:hypothetical protein